MQIAVNQPNNFYSKLYIPVNGIELKQLRKKSGLTQGELSAKTGIPQGTLSRFESTGEEIKKTDTLKKLEEIFKNEAFYTQNEENYSPLVSESKARWGNPPKSNDILTADLTWDEPIEVQSSGRFDIPIYNMPASASNIEIYGDARDVRVIGTLNIPGATKNSFALPVYGHSMYPTLANGNLGVVRPIENQTDVDWGNVYYIEYGDYRVFKRLIKDEEDTDNVILWSDNQSELVGGRPKYGSKTIKKEEIRRLCLLTDILQKPNY